MTTLKRSGYAGVLAIMFLFMSSFAAAQGTYTTVQAGNWNSSSTWEGGNKPSKTLNNFTQVNIRHDVTSSSQIVVKKGELDVSDGATLTVSSGKLVTQPNGRLDLNNGSLIVSNGNVVNKGKNNNGGLFLTDGYLKVVNGNFTIKNAGKVVFANGCIRVPNGNFKNESGGKVQGTEGSVDAGGNVENYGTWQAGVNYCGDGTSGSFPIPEDCDIVEEICDCLEEPCEPENPDVLPGFQGETNIISVGLGALGAGEANPNLEDELFIQDGGNVLIDINIKTDPSTAYSDLKLILASDYGINEPYVYDGFDPGADAPSNFISVFFPVSSLTAFDTDLNVEPLVNFVRQVSPPFINSINLITGSALNNQGDFAQETYLTRLGYELSGEGIVVGILSDGFNTRNANDDAGDDVAFGYLPGPANDSFPQEVDLVKDLGPQFGTGTDEGRAMAQIVHSVVPKADLKFHTAFEGPGPMAEAIVALGEECDITTDDVTHPTQPFWGGGLVADAIENSGAIHFTSAGNFASRAYLAPFRDEGGLHDFDPGPAVNTLQEVELGTGDYLMILQWQDLFYSLEAGTIDGAEYDFDVFITDEFGATIYSFQQPNLGGDPVEIVPFFVQNATTAYFKIQQSGGLPYTGDLKYILFKSGDDGNGFQPVGGSFGEWGAGTITGHALSPFAYTLAAVRYTETPTYGGTPVVEGFSSRGDAGQNKPDASAVQGANTSVPLGPDFDSDLLPNFFGTSASAPHAAAMAALLLEAESKFALTWDGVLQEMTDNAVPMGGTFEENGAGFLSSYDILTNFANPSPEISFVDVSGLGVDPTQGGEIVIEGSYFVDGTTQVFFRGEELTPTSTSDSAIVVTVPAYGGGNPEIVILNAEIATGDGGADTTAILDIPVTPIDIFALDVEKLYGESFELGWTSNGALTEEDSLLLDPFLDVTTAGTELTNTDQFPSINVSLNVPLEDLPDQLNELYEFNFVPGVMSTGPVKVVIQPTDFTETYGVQLLDVVKNYTYTIGNETTNIDPAIEAIMIDELNTDYLAIQESSGVNYLGIITNRSTGGFLSLSNAQKNSFLSLSNAEFDNGGIAFVTSENTLINVAAGGFLSLSNARVGGFLSLSNSGDVNVLPVEAEQFFDADDNFVLSTDERADWDGISNAFSQGRFLSLSNFEYLANAAADFNTNDEPPSIGISLSNGAALGFLSLSNAGTLGFLSLSNNLSLGFISLSNGDYGGSYSGFLSLSNSDNTEIISILSEDDVDILQLPEPDQMINMVPINVITGVGVGDQIAFPCAFLSDNLSRNYIVQYAVGEGTIEPASLDLEVDDASSTYGEDLPTITATLTGLQYDDVDTNVIAGFEFYSTIDNSPYEGAAGTYNIVPVYKDELNYDVTITNPGILTVEAREATLTIESFERDYGDDAPVYAATTSNLADGDSDTDIFSALSCDYEAGDDVGSYPITATLTDNPNYDLTIVAGFVNVSAKSITLDIASFGVDYGTAAPVYTALPSYLGGDDTNADVFSALNCDYTAGDDVGSYPITATLTANDNYDVTVNNGAVTVGAKAITLDIASFSIDYGTAAPVYTALPSYLGGDDTNADVFSALNCDYAAGDDVGSYPITATLTDNDNYDVTVNNGAVTVGAKAITLDIASFSIDYGTAAPVYTALPSYLGGDDTNADVFSALNCDYTAGDDVGSYPITATLTDNDNYDVTVNNGAVTVGAKAITLDIASFSIDYGTAAPVYTALPSYLGGDDTNADVFSALNCDYTAGDDVGSYPITATLTDNDNYDVTVNSGAVTVGAKAITLDIASFSIDYGTAAPVYTALPSYLGGDDTNADVFSALNCDYAAGDDVGSYPITATLTANDNYDVTVNNGAVTVGAKAITLDIASFSIDYGTAAPVYTALPSYLGGDDTNADVFSALNCDYTAGDDVGSYPITATLTDNDNYDVTVNNGAVTVGAKAIDLAIASFVLDYGDAAPIYTATPSYLGGDDTNADIFTSLNCDYDAGDDVGTYPITADLVVNGNYIVNVIPGDVTVGAKAITLNIATFDLDYGDAIPAYSATPSFLGGDDTDADIFSSLNCDYAQGDDIGTYPVTATLTVNPNYFVTVNDGAVNVGPKAIALDIASFNVLYGDDAPTYTATPSFLGGDDTNADVFTALNCDYGAGDDVGSYPITATLAVNPNYNVTVSSAAVTVGAIAITLDIASFGIDYGDAAPTYTASASFLGGDDTNADIFSSLDCDYGQGDDVGSYPVTATLTGNGNYIVTVNDGSVSVGKIDLIVTADDATREYGASDPSFALLYSGFIPGDGVGDITAPTAVPDASCDSDVGTYDINIVGGSATNYNIVAGLIPGQLTVTKAPLTVTANDIVVIYDDPEPTLTYAVDGYRCTDGFSDVFSGAGAITLVLDEPYDDPGYYEILVTVNETPTNYDVTALNGELFVDNPPDGDPLSFTQDLCINIDVGHPSGLDYEAKFLYRNTNGFPVFVENGPDNEFIGPAVTEGDPIEVFENGGFFGFRVFRVRFDGSDLQWTVTSYGVTDTSDVVNMNTNTCFFHVLKKMRMLMRTRTMRL